MGYRGPHMGRRRAERGRHLGNAIDRSGARTLFVAVESIWRRAKRIGRTYSPIRFSRSRSAGNLKWHFQQTHHDVWDYDSGNQPILFDMQVGGRRVKALAEASKNGYLYILNAKPASPSIRSRNAGPTDTTIRAISRGRRSRFRSRRPDNR